MTASLIYLLLCFSIYGKIQVNVQGFKVSDSCVCGIEVHRLGKIVGGQEVRPYAYPWMALIFKNGNMHCGGALISSRYVLTAGHCLDRSPKESLKLYLGVHYIREVQDREVLPEEIDSLILHKKYSPQMKSGDIGLIKLKNEIDHNRYHYICLPQKQVHYANEKAAASGWGKIAETGGLSEKLLEVNLTIISTKECQEHPSIGEYIRPSMICTREHERKDACNGDSGGPLMIAKHKGALKYWEEIGIVSFGFGCARPDVPAVYTRVFSYIDWIQDNTQDATYCKHPE